MLRQVPLHLLVELCLLRVVRRSLGLLEQGVIVRVLIVDKVVVRRGDEPLQQGPGGHVGGVHADHRGLELAVGVSLIHPGPPVHRLDLRCDAHRPQLFHQHGGGVDVGLVVGGDRDGHGEPVRIPRLRQKLPGPVRVIGVIVCQVLHKIFLEGRIHAGADGAAVPVKGQIDDLLLVHGIAQGLPHQLVVEGLHGVVQVQGLYQVHGALQHLEVVPQLGHLGAGQVGEHVDGPALQAHHQAVRVLDDPEGHLVQLGRGAPVVVEPLQNDGVLGCPGHELEGPGAHRSGVLLRIVLRQDGQGQIGQKFAVRLVQGDGQRGLIRVHGGNSRKRRDQGRSL